MNINKKNIFFFVLTSMKYSVFFFFFVNFNFLEISIRTYGLRLTTRNLINFIKINKS